jgi:hypothetical protein
MRRLILACALLLIAAAAWWFVGGRTQLSVSQPLTSDAIAQLEPEVCNESPLTQLLTIVPIAPRSFTRSMDIEQLALIDQYKGTGWRKVWILRLPAAYITQRTCDHGCKNWTGLGGDDLRVSQIYHLSLILTEDKVVPVTHVTKEQYDVGFPIDVTLYNRVWHPTKRHQTNAPRAMVNGYGRIDSKHPAKCREEESEIPELVRFRRIDPNERGGMHCGDQSAKGTKWEEKVYGKKIGDLTYEFIVDCHVNCRLYSDYNGCGLELMFPYNQLERWSFALGSINKLLDRYTAYIEFDDPNSHR